MSDEIPGPSTPPRYKHSAEQAQRAHTQPFVDGRGTVLAVRSFLDEATDLPGLTRLCEEELSEPYNVYTFRYFLTEWPHLTFFVYPAAEDAATDGAAPPQPIATIICKQAPHRERTNRGYIGMLSVTHAWRRRGIARKLVELAVREMEARGAQEIVLETEFDNAPSLALYEALGFVREKRLHRFYSNGKDAFRLILPLATHPLATDAAGVERARPPSTPGQMPPEVAYVLAGPGKASLDMAPLTLNDPPPPPRPPRPDYII